MLKLLQKYIAGRTNKFENGYVFVELVRLVIPFYIFMFPLFTVIAEIFLDSIDGDLAAQGVLNNRDYEKVDKTMDTWWYIWLLAYSYIALGQYFIFLLMLFVYRIIGWMVFIRKDHRFLLMLFPNFFEYAFFLFFFAKIFSFQNLLTGRPLYYSLAVIFTVKLLHEYWLHVKQKSLVEDVFKFKWRRWLT
jgi:hypothetical protein